MYVHKILKYHILLIIHGEKLLLFHIFTFIPRKAFTVISFYKISKHLHAKICQKNCSCKPICKNVKLFIANIKQYGLLLYSCIYHIAQNFL